MTDDNTSKSIDSLAQAAGTDQLNLARDTAQHFLDSAKAGEWAIDEETGTPLQDALTYALHRLVEIKINLYLLEQSPKVGNDTYAQKVSQHMLESVNSDERSLVPVLAKLQDYFTRWLESVRTALENYNAAEDASVSLLGKSNN